MPQHQPFTTRDRETFVRAFVKFLAAYVANNFDECCSHGRHDALRNPPVEDAIHLAEAAFEKIGTTIGFGDDIREFPVEVEADSDVVWLSQRDPDREESDMLCLADAEAVRELIRKLADALRLLQNDPLYGASN